VERHKAAPTGAKGAPVNDTKTDSDLRLATDEQIAELAEHIATMARRIVNGDYTVPGAHRALLADNIDTLATWVVR
jgi:hypothetical protein